MKITVSGKQIETSGTFRRHAEEQLELVVEKYFDRSIEATVTLSRAGQDMRVDIQAHAGRGITVQAHGTAEQANQALDLALDRIGKRLRRYKRRLKGHHRKERAQAKLDSLNVQRYILAPPPENTVEDDDTDPEAVSEDNPVIIAEVTREIDTLSVSDAVMHLDLADRSALVFRNAVNGQLNVVYRRRDGNIGWVDPQTD